MAQARVKPRVVGAKRTLEDRGHSYIMRVKPSLFSNAASTPAIA
jgi:hypothetical protein